MDSDKRKMKQTASKRKARRRKRNGGSGDGLIKTKMQRAPRKKFRDVAVAPLDRRPGVAGFFCHYCSQHFERTNDGQNHHKVCEKGPTRIKENFDKGFRRLATGKFECVHCDKFLRSKFSVLYHVKSKHGQAIVHRQQAKDIGPCKRKIRVGQIMGHKIEEENDSAVISQDQTHDMVCFNVADANATIKIEELEYFQANQEDTIGFINQSNLFEFSSESSNVSSREMDNGGIGHTTTKTRKALKRKTKCKKRDGDSVGHKLKKRQKAPRKKFRDVVVAPLDRRPGVAGFFCHYCSQHFDRTNDGVNHHKVCERGPTRIKENFDLGFRRLVTGGFECIHCEKLFRSKNGFFYHVNAKHGRGDVQNNKVKQIAHVNSNMEQNIKEELVDDVINEDRNQQMVSLNEVDTNTKTAVEQLTREQNEVKIKTEEYEDYQEYNWWRWEATATTEESNTCSSK